MKLNVQLAGRTIETTFADVAAVRFDCGFHGGMGKPFVLHRLMLDDNNNLRCQTCGQHPHETARKTILTQLGK